MATQWTAGLADFTALPAATLNTIGAAAETWTPVVTQSVNVTFTTAFARYQRIQNTVFVYARLNITSAGTANNFITVTIPITAKNTLGIAGFGSIYDTSATTVYNGFGFTVTSTSVSFAGDWAAGGTWGTNPNLAIASGDVIWLNLTYEAA